MRLLASTLVLLPALFVARPASGQSLEETCDYIERVIADHSVTLNGDMGVVPRVLTSRKIVSTSCVTGGGGTHLQTVEVSHWYDSGSTSEDYYESVIPLEYIELNEARGVRLDTRGRSNGENGSWSEIGNVQVVTVGDRVQRFRIENGRRTESVRSTDTVELNVHPDFAPRLVRAIRRAAELSGARDSDEGDPFAD